MEKTVLSQQDCQAIVLAAWNNGGRSEDPRFSVALARCGISSGQLNRLGRAARKVERSFHPGVILTPTSVGKRR